MKNPPANAEDPGSTPGSGRCPGGGNGNPLQCSCLENPMDRGAWGDTCTGCKSGTRLSLSPHTGGPRQQHPLFLLGWVWGLGGCRCVSGSDSLYPEHSVRTNLVDVRGQRACLHEAAAVCSVPTRSLVGTDGVPRVCPSRHLLPGNSRGIKTGCHIVPNAVDFRGTDGSGS